MSLIEQAAERLGKCRSIVILTGAGVSAESGVPTFRDALTGVWARHDPMQLATPEAFARHPRLVSRWYDERRQNVSRCAPNPGHHALADWQRVVGSRGGAFTLLTQNVDGLHQRAGSDDVVELHGSLLTWRCTKTGRERSDLPMPLPEYPMPSEEGGVYRPGIVWFGEMLPRRAQSRALSAIGVCDAVVSIGTSAVVDPAASFVTMAIDFGAVSVEVNLEPTPISERVDVSIRGRSGEVLPELVKLIVQQG